MYLLILYIIADIMPLLLPILLGTHLSWTQFFEPRKRSRFWYSVKMLNQYGLLLLAVAAAAFALFLPFFAFALSSSSLSRSESSPLAVLHRQAAQTIVDVRTHERDLLRSPHPAPSEPNN